EENETDPDHPDNKRLVVIKDMSWRSSTTCKFLRDYIDRTFNETSRSTCQRNHIHDNKHYIIGDALFRAPDWTLSRYNDHLKKYINDACNQSKKAKRQYTRSYDNNEDSDNDNISFYDDNFSIYDEPIENDNVISIETQATLKEERISNSVKQQKGPLSYIPFGMLRNLLKKLKN
ncbi:16945_t:CDS:2, partial [Funneliformis caledonium]